VEVNLAGTLTTADFTSDGKISPVGDPIHVIGDLVVRFQYDALGRLIMAQRVHSGGPPNPTYRTEHYYYDGVRRIQTVDDNATPANSTDDLTQHEYVYGPEYVDEFVLQSQRTVVGEQVVQKPFYMLQDGNYNVMALLDDTGVVVEQYQWEPYGLLAAKDTDTGGTIPQSHIGHQGLFFYRFDGADTLSLNALGLYYNRNRWYSPSLGRFTSRDPNESAQLLLENAMQGSSGISSVALSIGLLADSAARPYQYLCSNPFLYLDPLGLAQNHLYPLYLGGHAKGPGMSLDPRAHQAFHEYIHEQLGYRFGDDSRRVWRGLSEAERAGILAGAADAAGIDTTDPQFQAVLQEAMDMSIPGTKIARKGGKVKLYKLKKVSLTKRMSRGMRRILGKAGAKIDAGRAAGVGFAVATTALACIDLADRMSMDNEFFIDLAATTLKIKKTGQMTTMDEVGVLEDFYQLTRDPFSASYAWEYWHDSLW